MIKGWNQTGKGGLESPPQGGDILLSFETQIPKCTRQVMPSSVTKAKPQPSEMPNQTTSEARDGGQGLDLVSKSLATDARQGLFFFFFFLFGGW